MNWLPKLISIKVNLITSHMLVWSILILSDVDLTFMYYIPPAFKIVDSMNYGLMSLFVWVKVWLKTSEENSKKMVAVIERS